MQGKEPFEKREPVTEKRQTNAEREDMATSLEEVRVQIADNLRWVAWVRWVLGIVVGVALATMISVYIQRDNLIEGCLRAGDRAMIDVRFYDTAATKNERVAEESDSFEERDANMDASVEYRVYAQQKRATIPMPEDWNGDPQKRGDNREERVQGCNDAFPAPIPFIE